MHILTTQTNKILGMYIWVMKAVGTSKSVYCHQSTNRTEHDIQKFLLKEYERIT